MDAVARRYGKAPHEIADTMPLDWIERALMYAEAEGFARDFLSRQKR